MLSRLALACVALLPLASVHAQPARERAPNIVYIIADDLGYGDVGCYNPESKLPTPRIDQLAVEGMRFTDAHSAASCTPTRYGILTGRYAFRSRLPFNVLRPYDPPLIEADRLTVPGFLRQHGYHTACVGKWHLGWEWPAPDQNGARDFTAEIPGGPTSRGFDFYFGTDVPNYPPYAFIENTRLTAQPTAMFPGKDLEQHVVTPGPMVPGWKFEPIMPALAARVDSYLRDRAADRKPFFLFYTLTIPHEPLSPNAEFLGRSGINRVADLILETDVAVGAVLDSLQRLGLEKDTLVVFTSDNGHGPATGVPALLAAGHDPSRPFRGYKNSLLEGGHRVPFIVRWPGRIQPRSVSSDPISLNSLMATCAELLGKPLPAGAGEDSFSVAPILFGRRPSLPTHPGLLHATVRGFAARRGEWKLVQLHPGAAAPARQRPDAESGLFNLASDPTESRDVSAEHPAIVRELADLLTTLRRGDPRENIATPAAKQAPRPASPRN